MMYQTDYMMFCADTKMQFFVLYIQIRYVRFVYSVQRIASYGQFRAASDNCEMIKIRSVYDFLFLFYGFVASLSGIFSNTAQNYCKEYVRTNIPKIAILMRFVHKLCGFYIVFIPTT